MDALTALSLAGTILEFVTFGGKILRGSYDFYHSGSGALPVNEELELITRDLSDLIIKLNRPLEPEPKAVSSAEQSSHLELQKLCNGCKKVADELLSRLNRLKIQGKHHVWKSLQHAMKAAWAQKELEALNRRLVDFRTALDTQILSSLRSSTNLLSIQQSKRFDDLDERTRNIVIALLASHSKFKQDLDDQTTAIAQMLNRTEIVLTNQHDQTRALIVDAFQGVAEAQEEFGSRMEREKVAAVQKEEEEIKHSVENKILNRLYFNSIADRQEEVAEAHKNTFAWIFKPEMRSKPGSNFVEWLQFGSGAYWISGKAGSGKSTLMRYICESEETKQGLSKWAGSTPLTICNFFFWNSGTIEQRSQMGLLRSLLYDILRLHTELIPVVLPSLWARGYSVEVQSSRRREERLSREILIEAFKTILTQTAIPLKLCLFIDGLDEYEGEPSDMADLFRDLITSGNVKACLSSRPLVAFEYAFKSGPMLKLQDLTFNDIRLYVDDILHTNWRFEQLAILETEKAPALVNEVVNKADGVFLWVVLVVRSLLIGLGNRDEIMDLEGRLLELPSDISTLFDNMLTKRISSFYQVKASKLFQIVRASRQINNQIERRKEVPSPLTLLALSFADEKDPNHAMNALIQPLSELEISVRCDTMEDRLKNCCAGLLEVRGISYGEHGVSRIEIAKPGVKVQYLHRTVKDYLEQPHVWKTIADKTEGLGFDPDIQLLQSSILQVKASKFSKGLIQDSTWACVALGLEFARRAELRENPAYVPLLDHFDLVLTALVDQARQTYPGHWARYYLAHDERPFEWADTVLSLAVEYGLCSYLDYKLKQFNDKPCEKIGRPLLDYGVSQDPRRQRYPICPQAIAILLRHGANPNIPYNSTTPWENAIAFAYRTQFPELTLSSYGNERIKPDRREVMDLICLFKHFVNHGANLNESCVVRIKGYGDTYGQETERRPVLYVVKDVFVRWYPEESAELVKILKNKGASEELMSDYMVYGLMAWNKVREVRLRVW